MQGLGAVIWATPGEQARHPAFVFAAAYNSNVVTEGREDNSASNHMGAWPIAYTIEGIRDWLFAQSR